ncbi:cytochrome c [uncultured Tateyamaria sp.]|uniref:c-type cytochrome n=1 Tax=Tateyamaria sp. 1078 TaxID=3417464 RepID=UPI00262FAC60|nr:cytochrome c [uncultured Tateyamaria sp.]
MLIKKGVILGLVGAVVAGTIAIAGGHSGNPAVKARKAHMQLYAHNLGILGSMAKGEAEYDADQAVAAADNLVALATMKQMSYWPAGTSTEDLGEETRTLPVAWDPANWDDLMAKSAALADSAAAMQTAAGSLEGVQASIGALGGACGACHKVYRQPMN